MLRIIQSKSVSAAKQYYAHGLSKEDYYSEGRELIGEWGGKAAPLLGLSGPITREAFNALCDNLHPTTGERLTARTKDTRTVGYDLNFHCPKSVSLAYALTGDKDILSAFRAAVRETMQDIEQVMHTRVRKQGKNEERETRNAVWGEFIHFTARPVGDIEDPHLHAHCYMLNLTHDGTEQQWKAGQFQPIKRGAPLFEALFHARLAENVKGLGYGVELTARGWEIAGLEPATLTKFSRRTAEIEALAKAHNITDAHAKDQLGAKTRQGKHLGLDWNTLKFCWQNRLTPQEQHQLSSLKNHGATAPGVSERDAVTYALSHHLERASVVTEREVLTTALRHGLGSVSVDGIKREYAAANTITLNVGGQTLTTTHDVLREERALIAQVKQGRGICAPLGPAEYRFKADYLNAEQRAAVKHILRSRDQVFGIRGAAGTGKTSLLKEAAAALAEQGKTLYAFAPTAQASRGVLRQEGFAQADTVASLLQNPARQAALKNQVMLIDEAGLIGAKTMRQLLDVARAHNARVILCGDIRQHASVDRGDALRLLETEAGLKTASVNSIQRQRGSYKQAVESISHGEVEKGFIQLEALGAVVELQDGERYTQLAREYTATLASGKTALVVSPTHAEIAKTTEAIRAALRQQQRLDDKERSFPQLQNLSLTEAERGEARHYRPGQVVKFHKGAKGFKAGERVTVQQVSPDGQVQLMTERGVTRALPLDQAARFQVYDSGQITLAAGDMIRITQNGLSMPQKDSAQTKHPLHNGAVYEVAGFTKDGHLRLNNGWQVHRDFGHLAYGYASTSHSAQGRTTDRVFIAQSAASLPATSREQFYVSVSRGREAVRIFTDDRAALRDAVLGSAARMSATELLGKATNPPEPSLSGIEQARAHTARLSSLARAYASRTTGLVKHWLSRYDNTRRPDSERRQERHHIREREREYGR